MKIIKINKSKLAQKYNPEIFSVADAADESFASHKDIARKLRNKKPYTITIIIDNLNPRFWNNRNYVEKTKVSIQSLYKDILFEYFFNEFGREDGNELYAKWLDKYRPLLEKGKIKMDLDEYIIIIYGFSLINRERPIKSYLFLYSDDNRLYFIKDFLSLTVPRYDIGSNYHLTSVVEEKILSGINFIEWKDFNKLEELRIS